MGLFADSAEAGRALRALRDRERLLRSAYGAARYGWPETPAHALRARPDTFEEYEPMCRASLFLDAFSSPQES